MKTPPHAPFNNQQAFRAWPTLENYARHASLAGTDLFYYDSNPTSPGPVHILVHGLGDEADTWRGVFTALAGQGRLIAPDLPGFGRSQLPAQAPGIHVYIQALIALADQLRISRATWIGHSLGAILVEQLALDYPERVGGLVLVGGGLVAGQTRLNAALLMFLVPGIGEWAYNRLRRNAQAAYQTLYPYYANLDALPEDERAFLFERVNQRVWSNRQRTAFLSTLRNLAAWLPKQQSTLATRLAKLEAPTSVVWGAADQVAHPTNALAQLERLSPGVRRGLDIVSQAGHNVQQEQPQSIVRAVQRLAAPPA